MIRILEALIKQARDGISEAIINEKDMRMSVNNFITEFRCVSLSVPRQTGKTTALRELSSRSSAVLVTRREFNYRKEYDRLIGCKIPKGLKYSMILIDEAVKLPEDMLVYIDFLYSRNMLTEDFVVVMVGTK